MGTPKSDHRLDAASMMSESILQKMMRQTLNKEGIDHLISPPWVLDPTKPLPSPTDPQPTATQQIQDMYTQLRSSSPFPISTQLRSSSPFPIREYGPRTVSEVIEQVREPARKSDLFPLQVAIAAALEKAGIVVPKLTKKIANIVSDKYDEQDLFEGDLFTCIVQFHDIDIAVRVTSSADLSRNVVEVTDTEHNVGLGTDLFEEMTHAVFEAEATTPDRAAR